MSIGEGLTTSPTLLLELANLTNDEAAWTTFLNRYTPLIETWCRCRRLTEDEVEEVRDRVKLQLVRKLRVFFYDPQRRFRGWLYTLVMNEIATYQRRHVLGGRGSGDPAIQGLLDQLIEQESGHQAEDELEAALESNRDLKRVVESVQAKVSTQVWQVFVMRTLDEMAARDVAEKLGLTVHAVDQRNYRVRKLLKEEGKRLRQENNGRMGGDL